MTVFPGGPQDNIKYTLTAPDGSVGVFNDPLDANYIGMARFTGLDGVDIREAIDQRAGADGGVQGLNFRGPRAITATVDIVPTSTIDRNQKVTKMKRAINARIADGTMTFQPDGGAPQQQVKYRLSQPHRRGADKVGFTTQYQFALTCADPNIYSSALHTSTVNASPWQATITNQGDGLAPPQISITVAAAGGIVLSNLTTGKAVWLSSVDPAAFPATLSLTFAPGTVGAGNGQLSLPQRAVVDGSGNVFVSDYSNNRIQKFNSSGVYQSQFGTAGTGNGQFNGPTGLAIDGTGKIWVCDTGNNRIQRFSAAGAYETQFGSTGSANGQFQIPKGICLDGAGNIFVADSGNNRIQKLTAGTPPTFAAVFGGVAGSGTTQVTDPEDVIADAGGTNIFIVDSGNNRVKKVTNASPPVYVSDFGSFGSGNGQLNGPEGITRDSAGSLYIADNGNNRVQKFSSAGAYQSQFGGTGLFSQPQGVAMLSSTLTPVYVVDSSNNRVQKWDPTVSTLVLDFSIASVVGGGQNKYNYVNVPLSSWWSLSPGDNVIQVTGGTSWTINWRDAWE